MNITGADSEIYLHCGATRDANSDGCGRWRWRGYSGMEGVRGKEWLRLLLARIGQQPSWAPWAPEANDATTEWQILSSEMATDERVEIWQVREVPPLRHGMRMDLKKKLYGARQLRKEKLLASHSFPVATRERRRGWNQRDPAAGLRRESVPPGNSIGRNCLGIAVTGTRRESARAISLHPQILVVFQTLNFDFAWKLPLYWVGLRSFRQADLTPLASHLPNALILCASCGVKKYGANEVAAGCGSMTGDTGLQFCVVIRNCINTMGQDARMDVQKFIHVF
ncbi:hypothetical protein C8J57DRAFT_1244026 [Mycena rebaudengoi]|nr:hypothetical protein C8J57DRAFT_1244026 [Mycena rebaudengoi]